MMLLTDHLTWLRQSFDTLQAELVQRLNEIQSAIPRLQETNLRTNHKTRVLVAALEALHERIEVEKIPFDPEKYLAERKTSPTTKEGS